MQKYNFKSTVEMIKYAIKNKIVEWWAKRSTLELTFLLLLIPFHLELNQL
jgi:hypothetical protein